MGREIERRFLVTGDGWRPGAVATRLRQGYLSTDPRRIVRVRLVAGTAGEQATLTIKGHSAGAGPAAAERPEYEYPLPPADARELLDLCEQPLLEKTRHRVAYAGRTWEVDEFHGRNQGLVIAECELAAVDDPLEVPAWAGREVTGDPRYANSSLVARPFSDW